MTFFGEAFEIFKPSLLDWMGDLAQHGFDWVTTKYTELQEVIAEGFFMGRGTREDFERLDRQIQGIERILKKVNL